MSHFAEVKRVIVAEQDFINSNVVGDSFNWIQTSYNTRGGVHYAPNSNEPDDGIALRKNYAGLGDTYDQTRDAFIAPQPYPSWLLDDDTCQWGPPVPMPTVDHHNIKIYQWDESTISWVEDD